jgi:hypothetical protein
MEFYTNTDLNFSQTFRFKHGTNFTLQFQILNLFDQDFSTRTTTSISRDALVLGNDPGTLDAGPFFDGFVLTDKLNQRFNCQGVFATSSCVVGAAGRPNHCTASRISSADRDRRGSTFASRSKGDSVHANGQHSSECCPFSFVRAGEKGRGQRAQGRGRSELQGQRTRSHTAL